MKKAKSRLSHQHKEKSELAELKKAQAQAKEYLSGWQRAKADYLNYRKRMEKNRLELMKFCNTDLILQLLPVIDNFDHALNNLPENLKDNKWIAGIIAIQDQLLNVLRENGVTEVETEGKEFDPNLHEAVEHVKNKKFKSGMIVQELARGFKLHDRVIRPAKVKVAK